MPRSRSSARQPRQGERARPQGLFVVGPDLRVLATDAQLPFRLGMSAALMRGRQAADLFGADVATALGQLQADGEPRRCRLGGHAGEATIALVDADCVPALGAEPADVVGILARGLPGQPEEAAQVMPFVEVLQELCAQLLEVLSADPTPMLAAILERACANGSYDLATVWLLDDAGASLRPAAWRGYRNRAAVAALAGQVVSAAAGHSLRRVMADAAPLVEEDVPDAPGLYALKREAVVSAAFVPVRSRDRTLGVLDVGSRRPHRFYPGELRVLEILGSLAGVAVQKAQLSREAIKAERERDESRRELAHAFTVMRSMPDVVAALDADARLVFLNDAGRRLVGARPEDDLAAVTLARLMGPGAERRWLSELLPAALRGGTWSGEVALIGPGGRRKPFSVVLARHDRPDGSPYFSFVARDIRRLKSLERRLEGLATRDALTRVLNRRGFQAAIERHLARGIGAAARTLLFIDLDNFKEMNDTLGHGAGDALLRAVALRLRQLLPRGGVLARLGGDEFAALLRGGTPNARNVARHVLAGLRASRFPLPGGHWSGVTASIGIARAAGDAVDVGTLLSHADIALYQAKGRGRDTFSVYSEDTGRRWHRSAAELMSWEERVKRALQTDGFTLYAQPVVELRSGRPLYWELLLRMLDTDGALIPPDRFLRAAERSGLIGAVDRWVVLRAVRLLAAADPETCVGVNLSAKSLVDPEKVERAVSKYAAGGLAPRRLVFEITGTAQIAHLEDVRRSLDTLREHGHRTALDDFGVGSTSLTLLQELPLDFLKIDRRFVEPLGREPADRAILEGLVRIARGLGLRTVAEGIEDGDTLAALEGLGVDCGQGFHLARPSPVDLVADFAGDGRGTRPAAASGRPRAAHRP